jgi:hypothetical protein
MRLLRVGMMKHVNTILQVLLQDGIERHHMLAADRPASRNVAKEWIGRCQDRARLLHHLFWD